MLAYLAYQFMFWTVTPVLGWLAWKRRDFSLLRCALVMMLGEAAMSIWFGAFMPAGWKEQPAFAYAAVYLLQCALVTVHPSSKICSFIGGLFLSGFTISIVHLCLAGNAQTDALYWMNNLMLGWMTILVLAGGSTGEAGKHLLHSAWDRLVQMARAARSQGSWG